MKRTRTSICSHALSFMATALLTLALAVPLFAESTAASRTSSATGVDSSSVLNRKVTLIVNGKNIKEVLGAIVTQVPRLSLVIEGGDPSPIRNLSFNLSGVTLAEAMDAVLGPSRMDWRIEGNDLVVSPGPAAAGQPARGGSSSSSTPASSFGIETSSGSSMSRAVPETSAPDLVTLSISPMPVRDAVDALQPGWSFKDALGATPMPGANFICFPRKLAVALTIAAAGLEPPADGTMVVASKRSAGPPSIAQWLSAKPPAEPAVPVSARPRPAVSIGACKRGANWLYTILCDRAVDIDVVTRLLEASSARSMTTDLESRTATRVTVCRKNGVETKWGMDEKVSPSMVTVRLFDVSLDEALGCIVPTVGLVLTKSGSPQNPTYSISGSKQTNIVSQPYKLP